VRVGLVGGEEELTAFSASGRCDCLIDEGIALTKPTIKLRYTHDEGEKKREYRDRTDGDSSGAVNGETETVNHRRGS
jgi:hypothetical protein